MLCQQLSQVLTTYKVALSSVSQEEVVVIIFLRYIECVSQNVTDLCVSSYLLQCYQCICMVHSASS